jgi:hypothetical protein
MNSFLVSLSCIQNQSINILLLFYILDTHMYIHILSCSVRIKTRQNQSRCSNSNSNSPSHTFLSGESYKSTAEDEAKTRLLRYPTTYRKYAGHVIQSLYELFPLWGWVRRWLFLCYIFVWFS